MVSAGVLQLLVLACLCWDLPAGAENDNHLVTAPQSPVLEIGTYFTATCMIVDTTEVTADDLYWNVSKTTIPREQYTKINSTTLNVTLQVTGEKTEWLFCLCKEVSANVVLNQGRFIHGIYLQKGYRPEKPENLSCVAPQEKTRISNTVTCYWAAVGRQTQDVPTMYTLMFNVSSYRIFNASTQGNSVQVSLDIFPDHMDLDIWVEAHNKLGSVQSEHLRKDAGFIVKTDPPADIRVISEQSFPTSLLINWSHPINKRYLELTYQIRFRPDGLHSWTYVPLVDTAKGIQSFRLQNLQPDTVYVTQVRCKNAKEGYGHWSEWSASAATRTPEGRPTSKPDLWKIIAQGDEVNERRVQFVCKDPVLANGRIVRYEIKIQDLKDRARNRSWESVPVNRSEADAAADQRQISLLKEIRLADKRAVKAYVTAFNSAGKSDHALLIIPEKAHELPSVEELRAWPQGGKLWLQWTPPNSTTVSEYVVEWVTDDRLDWQRENRKARRVAIQGNLEKYVRYTVSVYPLYSGWTGKAATVEAYLEQGAPLEGPTVRLNRKPGRNEAELVWMEIPQHRRRGFITNYTIYYTSGTQSHAITVPATTTSYTLTSLLGNTKYDVWVRASTVVGSAEGTSHSFTTLKYAPGEIEFIVVGASLGFLFVFVITVLLFFYKREAIKRNFWPQIPNPGESTIGNWSPDYPLKAETPKENCLSGISVLDVDPCDGKCVFEEDKASLALKKDKYLSEEHSSGIGGSSCMSSPRQSVSDSDEGGDMADTTASTVQYSSVVASNGYKGQTPGSQPQQAIFSRSESTQPLLDSEENPDVSTQEGSRQSRRFLRPPCFAHGAGNEDELEMEQHGALEPLDFCSLEEDREQTTPTEEQSADWLPAAPISSYMPQLGGYRPQ